MANFKVVPDGTILYSSSISGGVTWEGMEFTYWISHKPIATDFNSDGSLKDKPGLEKLSGAGMVTYGERRRGIIKATIAPNRYIANQHKIDMQGIADGQHDYSEIHFVDKFSNAIVPIPIDVLLETLDGGTVHAEQAGGTPANIGKHGCETVKLKLFGIPDLDLNAVKNGASVQNDRHGSANLQNFKDYAISVDNTHADYKEIDVDMHNQHQHQATMYLWDDYQIDAGVKVVTGVGLYYKTGDEWAGHADFIVNRNAPFTPPSEDVPLIDFDIFEKVNCGCVVKIGSGHKDISSNIVDSTIQSSNLTGNLVGNTTDSTTLHGFATTGTNCTSPSSIRSYVSDSCGVTVNLDKEMYVAQFVNAQGCELYPPGAKDNKTPVCDKNDPTLNPPVPKGWKAITTGGTCADTHNTSCAKVEWSTPGDCNVVTKKIFIEHDSVQFTQKVCVNWYDQGTFRDSVGTISRNVIEDQVTGEWTYDQWDNSNIHFPDCVPFVGRFEQLGPKHDGDWRPLLFDRGWELLSEILDVCAGELRVNTMYTSLFNCDPDLNALGICQANQNVLKPIKPTFGTADSCGSCGSCGSNRKIAYTSQIFTADCTIGGSSCNVAANYHDTSTLSNKHYSLIDHNTSTLGGSVTTRNYNTSGCTTCK